jgi:hypothetical protein
MDNSLMVDEQTLWIPGVRHPCRKPYASNGKVPAKLSEFMEQLKKTFFKQ